MNRIIFIGTNRYSEVLLLLLDIGAVKSVTLSDFKKSALFQYTENADDTALPISAKYPVFLKNGANAERNANSVYVLGLCGASFMVINANTKNLFRIVTRSRLLRDIAAGTVYPLNAVVEETDGALHICPVSGEWQDVSYLKNIHLSDSVKTGQVDAKFFEHSSLSVMCVDAASPLDAQDSVLSQQRRNVLQTYYLWYSAETADDITGKARFITVKKAEKLNALRKVREKCRFAGFYDVWIKGAEKCELGHALRYVWLACPANMELKEAKKQGCAIKFGRQCAGDFLQISDAVIKRIWRAQQEMVDEIEYVTDVLLNGKVSAHYSYNESFIEVFNTLKTCGMAEEILGERISASISAFIGAGLPLVESLVLSSASKLKQYVLANDTEDKSGIHVLCAALGLNTSNLPAKIDGHSTSELLQLHVNSLNIVGCIERVPNAVFKALALFIGNEIAGEYRYDSTCDVTDYRRFNCKEYTRRNENGVKYAYSEESRQRRTFVLRILKRYGLGTDFARNYNGNTETLTFIGIKKRIDAFNSLVSVRQSIQNELGADYYAADTATREKISDIWEQYKHDMKQFKEAFISLDNFTQLWCVLLITLESSHHIGGINADILRRTMDENQAERIQTLVNWYNENNPCKEFIGNLRAMGHKEPKAEMQTMILIETQTAPEESVSVVKPQPVKSVLPLKDLSDKDLAEQAEKYLTQPFAKNYKWLKICEGIVAIYKRNSQKPLTFKQRWALGQFIQKGGVS